MRAALLMLAGISLAGCVADPAGTIGTPYAVGGGPAYGGLAFNGPAYGGPGYGTPGAAGFGDVGVAVPAYPALPPGGPYPGPAVLLPYGGGYGRDAARARFDDERRLRAERERADWARFQQQSFAQRQFERQRFEQQQFGQQRFGQQRFEQQRAQGQPGPDGRVPRPVPGLPARPVAEQRPPHPGHEPPNGPNPRPDWH